MELRRISAGYTSGHFSTDVPVIALWQAKNGTHATNAMVGLKTIVQNERYVSGIFDIR